MALTFSIVIPTLGRHNLLSRTLKQILLIDCKEIISVIVVIDNPDFKLDQATYFNKKLKVLRNTGISGESSAVNIGIASAIGDWIIVCSDDDPPLKSWFTDMKTAIEADREYHDVYIPSYIFFKSNPGKFQTRWSNPLPNLMVANMLKVPGGPGAIIRKSVLDKNSPIRNPEVQYPSDLIQWLNLLKSATFKYVPWVFSYWYQHPNQVSNTLDRNQKSILLEQAIQQWLHEKKLNTWMIKVMLYAKDLRRIQLETDSSTNLSLHQIRRYIKFFIKHIFSIYFLVLVLQILLSKAFSTICRYKYAWRYKEKRLKAQNEAEELC